MGKIKRYKNVIERFLSGEKGQRFFNAAYSLGAAVVILGALFKILHLPSGNFLLCVGMGTEVLMFILTAFDTPEENYRWENVFPVLRSNNPDDRPDFNTGGGIIINGGNGSGSGADGGNISGEIHITGDQAKAAVGIPAGIDLSEDDTKSLSDSIAKMSAASDQLAKMAEMTEATANYLDQISGIAEQMKQLRDTTVALNEASNTLLDSYQTISTNSSTLSEGSTGYVKQMEALNRNVGGLNTIYEIQLKSISSQLANIDSVNAGLKNMANMYQNIAGHSGKYCSETEKLAANMQLLNSVYQQMVQALTSSMYRPMPGAPMAQAPAPAAPASAQDGEISAVEAYRRHKEAENQG